jgi:4-hydroxybenzoate polyprenyltransferase/phosphoserine phosphatase
MPGNLAAWGILSMIATSGVEAAPREGASALSSTSNIPLVVDLDGTLVSTDLLYESYFASITRGFNHHWSVFKSLLKGKAALKAYLADAGAVTYQLLPYQPGVLEVIGAAKENGNSVYLATASDRKHAEAIAAHLGVFDGIFCSDGNTNLSGKEKARQLVARFGEKGFEYIGDRSVDIPVWSHARQAYVVSGSPALLRRVGNLGIPIQKIDGTRSSIRSWIKALRIHQYAKNALIFIALITSHAYTLRSFAHVLLAFLAFCACASSVYLLNDLVDLSEDRKHPSKRNRPFARGAIPLVQGLIATPVLLAIAFGCAAAVSLPFMGVLAGYFALTLSYSLSLKRKLMVDIIVLASLYTIRVVAGAVAISVAPSEWLLAFSMFMFTSLALVKRYVELAMRIDRDLPDPSNRNYRLRDLPTVGALASASGFNAVTIFALYASSSAVQTLYHRPEFLWLICPVLMYWLGRVIILAHRRVIDDDPIVFALRDRNSIVSGAAIVAILLLAS